MNEKQLDLLVALRDSGMTWNEIAPKFPGNTPNACRKAYYRYVRRPKKTAPKVLIIDIETAPIEAYVWDIWNVNVGLEQIIKDWAILSFSAKWLHAPASDVMYLDNRKEKDPRNDQKILNAIKSLLDEADIIITQNGVKFDVPKIKARMLLNGMKPFTSFKHIDTYRILKGFGLTSKKLAFTTDKLCVKYKKLSHGKFPGMTLWKECLNGNLEAWKEMEEYNKHDVLALEELYVDHLAKWDQTLNFAAFTDDLTFRCNCGSDNFTPRGYHITKKSKFRKYTCDVCGKEHRDSENLFSKEKRSTLKV